MTTTELQLRHLSQYLPGRAYSDASTISTDSEGVMSLSINRDISSGANVVSAGAADTCNSVGSATLLVSSSSPSSRSPSQPRPNPTRKLRRRKSSLAGATSPMSAIKSPSRSAGHALELQKHLIGSPLRTKSSSVSLAAAATDMIMTGAGVGGSHNIFSPEQNKFIERLRCENIRSLGRKPLRRVSMQPPAPPPTAALPPSLRFLESMPMSAPLPLDRMPLYPNMDEIASAPSMFRKSRDRSYSINTHDRIDEEMKEN